MNLPRPVGSARNWQLESGENSGQWGGTGRDQDRHYRRNYRANYDEPTIAGMHPMGGMGKPEEIAHGIAWLLSDKASFVTGHVLSMDGGFQAK
jgi:NAD(P)-dependent dehydrogenase (short-subunit alcohol dehydrogenase family)